MWLPCSCHAACQSSCGLGGVSLNDTTVATLNSKPQPVQGANLVSSLREHLDDLHVLTISKAD